MMLRGVIVLVLAMVLAPMAVLADTMLLVPGYLGSAHSYRASGVTFELARAGWVDAGTMVPGPAGAMAPNVKLPGKNRFFTIDMPTEAPLMVQSDYISQFVALAERLYPGERVILVGHSAGGVAARLAMVRFPRMKVYALITIAAPNLGSPLADVGSSLADSPLSWFAPFFGGNTINRSRVLYRDLGREGPWNILGWLNRTPHPKAKYISIVRTENGHPAAGDEVSPGWRQDLNMVPALRGKAQTYYSLGDHYLRPGDGVMLVQIVAKLDK